MKTNLLMCCLLALAACQTNHRTTPPPQAFESTVDQAIQAENRMPADRERDARSRPDVTLRMLGIGPGDVVLDVFAGGGYYSELIARVVGSEGKVYLHNNQAYRNYVNDALTQRLANNTMTQLQRHDREVDDLGITPNSLDAALIIMSYHDLYFADPNSGWDPIDHSDFMGQIHQGLKANGRFLIVDHHANPGTAASAAQGLHRIEKSFAIAQIESVGFDLVAESDVLGNPNDPRTASVFDPEMRGKTDRFILVFKKKP